MGILALTTEFETIRVRQEGDIGYIQIYRPDHNNTITQQLVVELNDVLSQMENNFSVVVLEGLPEVFCFGADFAGIQKDVSTLLNQPDAKIEQDPEPLYDVWLKLAQSPFVTVAHVRGKVNAGGIGFVAACDVVVSETKAMFSLSELLFGLMPACVLPFLIRRVGYAKANYMTVMTQPISANTAMEWGLVDAIEDNSANALRKHLLRLRLLGSKGVSRYKNYMNSLDNSLSQSKAHALQANKQVFSDRSNLMAISRYIETGKFPWE